MLPIVGRRIPIIADDYVDPEFGTGCVKITPAHDFNDYEIGKRHDLPMYNILTDDAALNDEVPERYKALDRFDRTQEDRRRVQRTGAAARRSKTTSSRFHAAIARTPWSSRT